MPCYPILIDFLSCLLLIFIDLAVLSQKDKEIDELKSKIAEVMAVMPPTTSSYSSLENSLVSSIYYNAMSNSSYNDHSSLDPNSSSYTSSTSDLQMN